MPFQGLQLPQSPPINSSFDFYSPLAKLGEQLAQNLNDADATKQIAALYEQLSRQQPAVAPAVAPAAAPAPTRSVAPAVAPPRLAPDPMPTRSLPVDPRDNPLGPFTPAQRIAGGFDALTPQTLVQRIAAGHDATTLPPVERIAGGFDTLSAQAPVERIAQGFQDARPGTRGVEPAAPQPTAYAPEPDPLAQSKTAISSIESGSASGNYRAVGPRTKTGDRAYGRYQVMGDNVPDWTEQYYGKRLTPGEFLKNPEAQEAVFQGKFGEYTQKYGPEGAARAWFAGPGGMNNPNASDGYKTVSQYAADFNRARGLPPEITAGTSRPQAPQGLPQPQAMAFDAAVNNLATPRAPAAAAGISKEQIAALYRNPVTRPLATAYLQKALDPGKYDFMVAGENIIRYNKNDGTYTEIPLKIKPMVVPEGAGIYDPNTRQMVAGDAGGPKLPKDYRWADPNDKSKGVVPIEGGPAEKIEADAAGRLGLAKSFLGELGTIKQRLESGELGVENPRNHAMGLAGIGAPGELRRKMDSGADALLRMLTGAGMNHEEAVDYTRRYRLAARDTTVSLQSKLTQLEQELRSVGAEIGKGRGGFQAAAPTATPGGAPRQLSESEYRAAPSGTVYLDPNGVPRRKR